jgi:gluconolactonase
MRRRFSLAALLFLSSAATQTFTDIHVEKLANKLQYAEGPVWSRDGYLLYCDIPANRIYSLIPPPAAGENENDNAAVALTDSRIALYRANSGGAAGNTFDAQGRLYTCETHTRRVTRTDRKGKIETLADKYQGKRLNSPNDIVVRHDGHVYFTDPAFGSANDARELDFYGIFHITPKGDLSLVANWPTRPNGLTFSPDGGTLYVSDSDLHLIRAFDVDQHGNASHQRVFISGIKGVPGGLRTDEHGNIYVAAADVPVYSSTGKQIGLIPTSEVPSNLAFGDEDFSSLYITAHTSVYRLHLQVKGSVQY